MGATLVFVQNLKIINATEKAQPIQDLTGPSGKGIELILGSIAIAINNAVSPICRHLAGTGFL